MSHFWFVLLLAVPLALGGSRGHTLQAADGNWPQFRGQSSHGVAENQDLPESWSATENVLWKQSIAGRGWSSPVVWGSRVFVTSVTSDEDSRASELKRGIYFGGDRHEPPKAVHQWRVMCLDLADGQILWEHVAHQGVPPQSAHLKNTYASETPVTDGERVFAYFGNLGAILLLGRWAAFMVADAGCVQDGRRHGDRRIAHRTPGSLIHS